MFSYWIRSYFRYVNKTLSFQGTTFMHSLIHLISTYWALLPFTALGVIISTSSLKLLLMRFIMFYKDSALTVPKQQFILPEEWCLNDPPFATAQRRILINGKENRVANSDVSWEKKRQRAKTVLNFLLFVMEEVTILHRILKERKCGIEINQLKT